MEPYIDCSECREIYGTGLMCEVCAVEIERDECLNRLLRDTHYFGCEKCDSTWMYDPDVCTHCGNPDLYESDLPDYSTRHCS